MLLMGKSTISMAIFHCYVSSPEGIPLVPFASLLSSLDPSVGTCSAGSFELHKVAMEMIHHPRSMEFSVFMII